MDSATSSATMLQMFVCGWKLRRVDTQSPIFEDEIRLR
jgi:hypothetical protein